MNGGWGISYEIAPRWMLLDFSGDKSSLVQVMACCPQANVDPDLCCQMESLSHNELIDPCYLNWPLPRYTKRKVSYTQIGPTLYQTTWLVHDLFMEIPRQTSTNIRCACHLRGWSIYNAKSVGANVKPVWYQNTLWRNRSCHPVPSVYRKAK